MQLCLCFGFDFKFLGRFSYHNTAGLRFYVIIVLFHLPITTTICWLFVFFFFIFFLQLFLSFSSDFKLLGRFSHHYTRSITRDIILYHLFFFVFFWFTCISCHLSTVNLSRLCLMLVSLCLLIERFTTRFEIIVRFCNIDTNDSLLHFLWNSSIKFWLFFTFLIRLCRATIALICLPTKIKRNKIIFTVTKMKYLFRSDKKHLQLPYHIQRIRTDLHRHFCFCFLFFDVRIVGALLLERLCESFGLLFPSHGQFFLLF